MPERRFYNLLWLAYGADPTLFADVVENGFLPKRRAENIELLKLGSKGFTGDDGRQSILFFDLQATPLHSDWRGKLVVGWPRPERGWYRRAHKNTMPVLAIREESVFAAALPSWEEVKFTWAELSILPSRWRAALEQWRGIYSIWDASDGKSHVGSAYGGTNILGRWEGYAATGHGGNKLLRLGDPANFRLTILQRVSPDLADAEVIRLENSWKLRLHCYRLMGPQPVFDTPVDGPSFSLC